MPSAGSEPKIPTTQQPHTYALDHTATRIGTKMMLLHPILSEFNSRHITVTRFCHIHFHSITKISSFYVANSLGSRIWRFNTTNAKAVTGHDSTPPLLRTYVPKIHPTSEPTLWYKNPKAQQRPHQSLPLDTIQSQFHPSPILMTYFPKIHLIHELILSLKKLQVLYC